MKNFSACPAALVTENVYFSARFAAVEMTGKSFAR